MPLKTAFASMFPEGGIMVRIEAVGAEQRSARTGSNNPYEIAARFPSREKGKTEWSIRGRRI